MDALILDGTNVFRSVALADDGKFLLAARKYRRPSCTEYLISFDARDTPKGNGTYIGKLR
jgi:tubby and related proteins